MDKKNFLKHFDEYDSNYIANIYEDIKLCREIGISITTKEFITPDIYSKLSSLKNELGINIYSNGFFEDAERRILVFSTELDMDLFYHSTLLVIENKSKFKDLQHKDYLGSIMALGIKRNFIGDLIVKDSKCYVPVVDEISEYIIGNLDQVGRCPCTIRKFNGSNEELPSADFKELSIISTSFRLDSIVSSICNISRGKSSTMINSGQVLVNYIQCNEKNKEVKVMDTITIKGYGKYKVYSVTGETMKGRIKLVIRRYI